MTLTGSVINNNEIRIYLFYCSASDKRQDKQYNKNKEQDLRYACGARRYTTKSKNRSYNSYYKKDDRPA